MKLKNGFKLIYEKKVEEKRKLFASKQGIPTVDDEAIDVGLTEEEIKAAKLIYEKDDSLVASEDLIPSADDKAFKLTVDGEEVIGGDDEPVPPVPPVVLLSEFVGGHTISGYDFGDVENGDINDSLNSFLLSLPLSSNDPTVLVAGDNDILLQVIHSDDLGAKHETGAVLFTSDDNMTFLYSTLSFDFDGGHIDAGYQNLENGKYELAGEEGSSTIYEDGVNEEVTGWNGILVGAIEEE